VLDANGKLRDEVKEAKARGVQFDIGHGVGSFSFETAERALDQGFDDISISSDLYTLSTAKYARTFANVLTSFLMLGMPLEQIMYKCSVKPAENISIKRGIAEGAEANLTVFKVAEGDFVCQDTTGQKRKAARRIFPEWSVVAGKVTKAGNLDRKLFL
jgi:dihydroorotase